jgi:hypothetical protein
MRTALRSTSRLTCTVLSLLFLSIGLFGQNDNSELLERKVTLAVKDATFVYTLGKLSLDHDVPLGLVKSSTHADVPNISLDLKQASLRKVLDMIVTYEPTYRWELVDGVINFIPNENRNEFICKFLELSISQISFPREIEIDSYSVKKQIFGLQEVSQLMNSNGVKAAGFVYETPSGQSVFSNRTGNRSFSNLTIRTLLNRILTESDQNSWVLEMVGDGKNLLLSL